MLRTVISLGRCTGKGNGESQRGIYDSTRGEGLHRPLICLMTFNIKMKDFSFKAQLVTGDQITETSATILYAGVVSRDTVRIALMITTLNYLKFKSANILNAYIQVPVT